MRLLYKLITYTRNKYREMLRMNIFKHMRYNFHEASPMEIVCVLTVYI
jgi:hypothetical protein